MPIDQQAAMAAMAARAQGNPAPEVQAQAQPDAAAAAQAEAQAAQVAANAAPEKDTAQDKAIEAGAPNDPSAKMGQEPIRYEVEMEDGTKRMMTPAQIKGMTERYTSLNYKHAQMKPVLEIVERMLESNPGAKPEHVAQFMLAQLRAGESNAQMGGTAKTNEGQSKPADVDPFEAWEKDNAATLPPGYREMMQGNGGIQQEIAQLKAMLGQVLGASQGVASAARAGQEDARGTQVNAIQRTIAANVDRAQQQLGLPDSEAEPFLNFAAERGYMLEDFVDGQLALRVMQDYKNTANSPEFERLSSINQKRQAWTGSDLAQTAAAGGGAPAADGKESAMFTKFADKVLAKKQG